MILPSFIYTYFILGDFPPTVMASGTWQYTTIKSESSCILVPFSQLYVVTKLPVFSFDAFFLLETLKILCCCLVCIYKEQMSKLLLLLLVTVLYTRENYLLFSQQKPTFYQPKLLIFGLYQLEKLIFSKESTYVYITTTT